MTRLLIDEEVRERFPDLTALLTELSGLKVQKSSPELEEFKKTVYERIRSRYRVEELKNESIIRLYRDFFWRIGVDPTKTRPAAEALIRRILRTGSLPTINTLVDSYNLASAESRIALAAFDAEEIEGDLVMRFAEPGERFLGIGMEKPRILKGGEIVVSDSRGLVAIYPYRDADRSKVTLKTRRIYLMTCGVPGIPLETLRAAEALAAQYVEKFCSEEY
ncbi:MAG: hypothetical protein J7J94_03125 [Thaumarchaeota archaeon]|nr:hypothetical protein [Nitrososphaerota archaeon]